MKKITFFLMALLVSLASFAQATVPTNEELWEAFKPYYNEFYGLERADQPIENVASFAPNYMQDIMTNEASKFKWLGDYILEVAAAQEFVTDSEGKWRWHVDSFFNKRVRTAWPGSADFTEAGKPENWGPAYLAAQGGTTPEPEPEPEPTTETVYFVNAANWTKVNAYAWTTDPNASWPGVAATKEAEQIAGFDVYSYTAAPSTYANVIFNNGSGQQTADLVWTAGKYYVKDAWYTKEEAEAKLAAPVEYESVYFVDNQGWGKANIYTWTPEVATWPGVAMTKEADKLAGYDVYSYTVEKGTSFGGMLFNNANGVQTGDLKWTAGKYYVKDAWYTKEEAEAKLAGPVTPPVITYVLMGVKGDWTTGIAMTQNPDNANEYVLLQQEILEGDAVKVVTLTDGTATAWCGNVDEYSVAHTADDMGNIVLAPGKYDFYYKVAEDLIYIGGEAYPEEPEEPEQPEVEKPEPTYTDNNLNPYAFGLESVLSEDKATLTVNYRLNNSKATKADVIVKNGQDTIVIVAGTTNIGKNTVEISTEGFPTGVDITWAVIVNGTSVEAPTLEEKIYSFFHPSSVDVDNNPENPTFGMLLVNEAMQSVASKTEGYVSAGFGAGIFAFTPSFDLIPNGELPGYNGGKTFSTATNMFAPRRIRISEDGRIFATAQDGSGEYLWEINPENLNEWTTVFQGTNDGYALKDAEGNFIAGTNSGFDVRGEGENLQLLMLSSSLPGAQVGSFKCHTYDLGTATTWATAPTKEIPGANYMLVTNQSNVQFDKDGGVWYIQYRGTTTDKEPGLVHINKDGVEDLKVLRNYARNAGFRFTPDFSKVVIAGTTAGTANPKKATVYAVSADENGVPVLTEEVVIDMAVVGNNLNDFAWDYAGNLYACGNSSEKLAAWAMPYSGEVVTPAAAKYAFQLEGTGSGYEVYEEEITNLVIDLDNLVLIGGPSANFQVDVYLGLGEYNRNDDTYQLLPESSIAVFGQDATFIEGYAYEVDAFTPSAKAVVRCEYKGMLIEFHLTMTAAPMEATVVVVENAAIEIEKYLLFGDMYDYALKMTGVWHNEEDNLDYPVLVEVPVYYPEATEPSEIMSTVTVGGWGDEDPWLGFGEGTLTVTTVGNTITATGIVQNPMAGVAIDITISGNLTTTGIEDATVVIKPIKMIKNNQLIINKGDVQYNINGAIVK